MALLHRLLFAAGKKIAADPRVREKVVRTYREDVRPAAAEAWSRARPRVAEARAEIRRFVDEVRKKSDGGK